MSNTVQAFLDIQTRFVNYTTTGLTSERAPIDVDEDFKFFNPKFGLTYTLNGNNSIYASYARANKEPNRNDFESNATDVKHETLNDFELGWRHQSKGFSLNANLYYMQYNNQLVLTGALDNVGEYLRENVDSSYRLGLELDASIVLTEQLTLNSNLALSKNKIQDLTINRDGGIQNFGDTNIAFSPITIVLEFLEVDGYGRFEAYANRDSLKYQNIYGLNAIQTLYRGTIRRVGFGKAWQIFIMLGMTDDSYTIEDSEHMSYRDFVNSFLPYSHSDSVELKLRHQLKIDQDDIIWEKLEELDLFNHNKKVELKNATPAQILQKILMDSWTLKQEDKDMIVMYHKFGYELNGKKYQIDATMVCKGDNQTYTAMAKTVGLPVAIGTLKLLNNEFNLKGVQIPIKKAIYKPILNELEDFDIIFKEKQVKYLGYNILNT